MPLLYVLHNFNKSINKLENKNYLVKKSRVVGFLKGLEPIVLFEDMELRLRNNFGYCFGGHPSAARDINISSGDHIKIKYYINKRSGIDYDDIACIIEVYKKTEKKK